MILDEILTDGAKKHLLDLENQIEVSKKKKEKETDKLNLVIKTIEEKLVELGAVTSKLNSAEDELNKMVENALYSIKLEKENMDSELLTSKSELNLTNHHLGESRRKIDEYELDIDRLIGKIDQVLEKERIAQELFKKAEELNKDTTRKKDEFIENPLSIGFHVSKLQSKLDSMNVKLNVLKEIQ